MNSHLFESFSKMIDRLPVTGVISATEREHQMLENDLATNRPVSPKEAHSILSFCNFLTAIKSGLRMSPVVLPPTDTAFYRRTTTRLVEAGELPVKAHELFDETFTVPLLQSFERVH